MRVIRRISVGSAFKVGAVVSGLLWAILGGILLVLQLLFGSIIAGAIGGRDGAGALLGGGLVAIIIYVVLVAVYAVAGGISSALSALFYNLAAGWFGGLEIEMD